MSKARLVFRYEISDLLYHYERLKDKEAIHSRDKPVFDLGSNGIC